MPPIPRDGLVLFVLPFVSGIRQTWRVGVAEPTVVLPLDAMEVVSDYRLYEATASYRQRQFHPLSDVWQPVFDRASDTSKSVE